MLYTCFSQLACSRWSALRGFELDQLSQNVPLPARNHSINPVRSYLQCLRAHSRAVPGGDYRPASSQAIFFLLRNCVSLLGSWSASSLPISEKPLSLALYSVLGQTLIQGYAIWYQWLRLASRAAADASSMANVDTWTDNGNICWNLLYSSTLLLLTIKQRPTDKKAMAPGRRVQQEHTRIQISEP